MDTNKSKYYAIFLRNNIIESKIKQKTFFAKEIGHYGRH